MSNRLKETIQENFYEYYSGIKDSLPEFEDYLNHLTKSGNIHQDLVMVHSEVEIHLDITTDTKEPVHLHSHAFYEILFCNGGCVDYMLGGNRYNVMRGDIILIPPGVSHRPLFKEDSHEEYERYVLWLDSSFLNNAMKRYEELNFAFTQCEKQGTYLLRTPRPTWEGLLTGIKSIWNEFQQKKPGWQLCITTGALMLMTHISRTYYYRNTESFPVKNTSLADEIFRYIDVNLAQKLTLQSIADQFYISKSSVSHLFSAQMGVSLYKCIIQRRLIAAKTHILYGMPLRQVWETCGFADHAAFYRLFKKEYGVSPQKFRTTYSVKSYEKSVVTK